MNFFNRFKKEIKIAPVKSEREQVLDHYSALAAEHGIEFFDDLDRGVIIITRGNERFLIASEHFIYAADFVKQFDYYFSTVEPVRVDAYDVQDFSKPGWHIMRATGERFYFTSTAEDIRATQDYVAQLDPQPGEVVIDVGAYCGLSALTFSRAVGPRGRVVAVEPDPRNMEALRLNLQNVENVQIINKAIAGERGEVLFLSEGNMGAAIVAGATGRNKTIAIEAVTLGDIVEDAKLLKVDIVKIDIEGAEYGVIESSEDLISSLGARWSVELHMDLVTSQPINVERVRGVFDRAGYKSWLQEAGAHVGAPTIFAWPR
jgi:FkbM family methyltransferase